jgi:stage V sporulation protein R
MDYEQLAKGYTFGLQRIYEMVINNDPTYAYLLECNAEVDQKIVMAHVFAHGDFFKHNLWFSKTNRKMMDEMANHATRVRRYMDRHGVDKVENFIDVCLSIENLIDPHSLFITRERPAPVREEPPPVPRRLRSKEYMEEFVNPPEYIARQEMRLREERERKRGFPDEPARDVLKFLVEYSPLENWERDVLSIVREEAYYFAPQAQTKIMNEGWATYWHSKIMTERCLTDAEVVDYADHHSGTVATHPGRLNPYKLGVELFRDIEERWNKGRFGKEYDECEDLRERMHWDRQLGQGREKIFEVRRFGNDVTFIDNYLTEEFCRRHRMFVYDFNPKTGLYQISSRSFKEIKQKLLFHLTNRGLPFIEVADGNYRNKGELLLRHRYEGVPLRMDYARDTLRNVHRIWQRPVNLATLVDDKPRRISFNGEAFEEAESHDRVA